MDEYWAEELEREADREFDEALIEQLEEMADKGELENYPGLKGAWEIIVEQLY